MQIRGGEITEANLAKKTHIPDFWWGGGGREDGKPGK